MLEIDEHSIHSPFVFDLYVNAIKNAIKIPDDPAIENLRKKYQKDKKFFQTNDLGAGSLVQKNNRKRISDIARHGITKLKYSKLLVSLINYFQCEHILELGTSLGLNTLYLAKGKYVKRLKTFEGDQQLVHMALKNFRSSPGNKIDLIKGNISDTLYQYLGQNDDIDFVYMDANHTYDATLTYTQLIAPKLSTLAVLVIDDIYWSAEMAKAWKKICESFATKLCLDIFQFGIVIFKKNGPEGYYRLAY